MAQKSPILNHCLTLYEKKEISFADMLVGATLVLAANNEMLKAKLVEIHQNIPVLKGMEMPAEFNLEVKDGKIGIGRIDKGKGASGVEEVSSYVPGPRTGEGEVKDSLGAEEPRDRD